uniref:Uncharacterized protein n=1 Tax=Anguilla anguilla TaxID=7936 RepID=A0A0E9UG39_ANGAN
MSIKFFLQGLLSSSGKRINLFFHFCRSGMSACTQCCRRQQHLELHPHPPSETQRSGTLGSPRML